MTLDFICNYINEHTKYHAEITTVNKGGADRQGLVVCVNKEDIIKPVFYEDTFKECKSLRDCLEFIDGAMEHKPSGMEELSGLNFSEFNQIKSRLIKCVGPRSATQKLVRRPFSKEADIFTYARILLESVSGSIAVTTQMLEAWGISEAELFRTLNENEAKSNPYVVKTTLGLTICERKNGPFGAAAMGNKEIIKECLSIHPNGFYFVPSSVHEVIVIPADFDQETLEIIIKNVNENTIDPGEYLSNTPIKISNVLANRKLTKMISDFGVATSFNNVTDDNPIEKEGYWYECPICGEPILLEDWGTKTFIGNNCPICEENFYTDENW